MTPLWTAGAIAEATGADLAIAPDAPISAISIDTRTLVPGSLYVALHGVSQDGHRFVDAAFEAGAAACLVEDDYSGDDPRLLRVPDTLRGLEQIAAAARARNAGRIVAVTGSAGKTTSKEILRAMFEAIAPGRVHAAAKSFNNHWGVPLTLANLPADAAYAVFEIGMNHPGEIRPLVKLVRPHVSMITTIAAAHLGHFSGLEEIAEAKAEIFEGLAGDGTATGWAVVPSDAPHADLLIRRALGHLAEPGFLFTFGTGADATLLLRDLELSPTRSRAAIRGPADTLRFELNLAGAHNAMNAAGCIAAWFCATAGQLMPEGPDDEGYPGFGRIRRALASLSVDPAGRGQVHDLADGITLIDESYNANPSSMRAALATLALYPADRRRIAVLGDMLELGDASQQLHGDLASAVREARVDAAFLCGPDMAVLANRISPPRDDAAANDTDRIAVTHAPTSSDLEQLLLAGVRSGDVIVVKGSLGSRMAPLVAALRSQFCAPKTEGG
ncbi:MAG: UDP-N-acetylmuramoyl-tripeptide--D-alanyl-D-alanine ligase [Pseudomonadota bacterium]